MDKNKSRKSKTTVNIKDIKLQYIKGAAVDSATLKSALRMFGLLMAMGVVYLLMGLMMMVEHQTLSTLLNTAVILAGCMLFYTSGASYGESAVNQGEMMYNRQQSGGAVSEKERRNCYHPMKGAVVALLGSLPVIIASVTLALIAQRQMTGIGTLPTWVSTFESRSEIGNALKIYHQDIALTLQDILRVFVRMLMMPAVNIVSFHGADALLTLERLSPLMMILPGLSYAVGYMQGVRLRKRVHASIAEGEMKRKRKEKRQRRQQRKPVNKGPEQLN